MPIILIHSPHTTNDQMFETDERVGIEYDAINLVKDRNMLEGTLTRVNDPLIYLKEHLTKHGYDLKSADDNPVKDCEWVFFYDYKSVKPYSGLKGFARKIKTVIKGKPLIRNLYDECIRSGMKQRIALFLWEAPAVCPENMNPKLHKLFPVIFTSHDELVDGCEIFKICVPQARQFPQFPRLQFAERKLLVNISMNKFSNHPDELYSARRTAIRHFEQAHPDSFDLFGVRWNRQGTLKEKYMFWKYGPYKSYRGAIKNKWEVMPKYRFSLCYENVRDVPGYVTEKIFDSMRCGCVPIYWGANNITDYVDAEAFIDRRRFKSDIELDEYISNITEYEYSKYQNAIQKYLAGPRFEKFLPPAFAGIIIKTLKLI